MKQYPLVRARMLALYATDLALIGSVPANGFDLIIANAAIPLASRAKKILLIFAQLLLSFQHIKAGGALIVSLPTRPFVWVIDVVATLKHTFQFVDAVKPAFQAKTSFAYFVCQGFRAVEATKQQYIHRLCSRIYYLKEAGKPHTQPWLEN